MGPATLSSRSWQGSMKSVVAILEQEGFVPISPASQKVADALVTAFAKLGEDCSGTLMEQLSILNKLRFT